MKDLDTKILESMYDNVGGVSESDPILLTEDVGEYSQYITEEIIDVLGQNLAAKLIGLVKRDIPACNDNNCAKRLEQMAQLVINSIEKHITNPMVMRTLKDYEGVPALSKVKVIYQLLSTAL